MCSNFGATFDQSCRGVSLADDIDGVVGGTSEPPPGGEDDLDEGTFAFGCRGNDAAGDCGACVVVIPPHSTTITGKPVHSAGALWCRHERVSGEAITGLTSYETTDTDGQHPAAVTEDAPLGNLVVIGVDRGAEQLFTPRLLQGAHVFRAAFGEVVRIRDIHQVQVGHHPREPERQECADVGTFPGLRWCVDDQESFTRLVENGFKDALLDVLDPGERDPWLPPHLLPDVTADERRQRHLLRVVRLLVIRHRWSSFRWRGAVARRWSAREATPARRSSPSERPRRAPSRPRGPRYASRPSNDPVGG